MVTDSSATRHADVERPALFGGHFVYPTGKHSPHYFQMPLAFRYYDTARVLAVALSRTFRVERDISSQLPKIAVISPSSGGIPVAFGVRDALSAEQIYWAEQENGERMFRQYVNQGEVNACIIVDDLIRYGEVQTPWVGAVVQNLSEDLADHFGVARRVRADEDSAEGAPAGDPILEKALEVLRDEIKKAA